MSADQAIPPGAPAELVPQQWYGRLLRRFPWVFAAALLGGLIGLGLSSLFPPTYRATAILAIGVDYGRSVWLDEDADRLVMGRVQGLILSDDVLGAVLARVTDDADGGQAPSLSMSELRNGMRLVWFDNRWELSFAGRDPTQAAATANAWAEVSLDQLRAASEHAWRVAELQGLFFRVFCRPEDLSSGSGDAFWVCDEDDPDPSRAQLPAELRVEIEASRGIPPALSFAWEATASPASEPARGGRAPMILAGLLVGLLIGAFAAIATGDPWV